MADATDRRTTWAIIIVVLLVLFLLLSRCTGSNGSSKVGAVPNSAGPAEPAPGPTEPVVEGNGDSQDDGSGDNSQDDNRGDGVDQGAQDAAAGTVTVDGEPLRSRDLGRLTGKRAVARGARVLAVPADEGFWLSTGGSDQVWVQLTGLPPESPYTVRPGDWVSFTGRITPNGSGFARRVGVTRAEGAAALTADRRHLNVTKRGLTLTHP